MRLTVALDVPKVILSSTNLRSSVSVGVSGVGEVDSLISVTVPVGGHRRPSAVVGALLKHAAALLLLTLIAPGYGQMYRWPDKDGRIHYSDTPPPGAKDQRRAATPNARPGSNDDATPRPRQSGSPRAELAGGPFLPEEQAAARVVCSIAFMEKRQCAASLNRYCSLDELIKGVDGNRAVAFRPDPRTDPNYQYRVDIRGGAIAISADARRPGLAGFFSEGEDIRYNARGSAGKTDTVAKGGANCQGFIKSAYRHER